MVEQKPGKLRERDREVIGFELSEREREGGGREREREGGGERERCTEKRRRDLKPVKK